MSIFRRKKQPPTPASEPQSDPAAVLRKLFPTSVFPTSAQINVTSPPQGCSFCSHVVSDLATYPSQVHGRCSFCGRTFLFPVTWFYPKNGNMLAAAKVDTYSDSSTEIKKFSTMTTSFTIKLS